MIEFCSKVIPLAQGGAFRRNKKLKVEPRYIPCYIGSIHEMAKSSHKGFRNQFQPALLHLRSLSGQLLPLLQCYSTVQMHCVTCYKGLLFFNAEQLVWFGLSLSVLFGVYLLYIFVANGCQWCNHMTWQWHFRAEAKFCPLGWSRLHSHYTPQKFIGISGCDVKGKCHMKDLQVNREHEKERGRMEQKYSGNIT